MNKKPWMPLYIGDYLKDTGRLTTEAHGAYLLLIMDYWTSERPLPDDDRQLAAITKLPLKTWRRYREILKQLFKIEGGFWKHKRVEIELTKIREFTNGRSEAGKMGAKKRWQNDSKEDGKGDSKTMAEPSPSHEFAIPPLLLSPHTPHITTPPSPSLSEKTIKLATPTRVSPLNDVVEAWNAVCTAVGPVKIRVLSANRKRLLQHRIDVLGLEAVMSAVQAVARSPFLMGETERRNGHSNWRPDFGWFLKEDNFIKIMEGKYSNDDNDVPERRRPSAPPPPLVRRQEDTVGEVRGE